MSDVQILAVTFVAYNDQPSISVDFDQIDEGSDVVFTCTADSSSDPTNYGWYKDGSVIVNENSNTYTKVNALPADSGTYTCDVTTVDGVSVVSDGQLLTVDAFEEW